MSEASLRLVVLSYGVGEEHRALLDSLVAEGLALERVLVVHNPSSPGERLDPPPAGCEVVETERNLGYAAAMNLGIRHQLGRGCELLLLLTHDARLRPGAVRELIAAAERNPSYGVLGPALLFSGSEEPFSFGGLTGPGGKVRHRKTAPSAPDGVAPCDWIDGGTMLFHAVALERVGGFDERLWSYCEDADLCLRLRHAGFEVGVAVGARADQAPGGAKRPGAWAYLLTRNGIAYARRFAGWRGLFAGLTRASWQVVLSLARSAVRAIGVRPGPARVTWAIAVGTAWGVVDLALGRWGPPPADLPGMGDLRNTQPPPSQGALGGG